MPGKSPGPSIHNPATYEALKKKGLSKASAAAISNAALNKGYAKGRHHSKDDDDDARDGASIEWLAHRGDANAAHDWTLDEASYRKRAAMTRLITADREFSTERRRRLAKSGAAMKGGGFPIVSKEDLKNAIRAVGRAKNPAAAKAHIKQRARALGATSLLPENWDAAMVTHKTAPIYDEWMEIEDGSVCPECHGDGLDEEGDICDTCTGEGYVGLPANLDQQDAVEADDEDEDETDCGPGGKRRRKMDALQLTETFVLDGGVRKTKAGYLVADARVARTGIQLYTGDEIGIPHMKEVRVYRPPEEVFSKASMHSLAHIPITLTHPPHMVDAGNWDEHAVGHTGDEVTRDGEFVRVPMLIMDGKAIEAYEKHGVKELSVGYSTELRWGKGTTPNGETYDAKQTAIRGNHLAVVPAARGGSLLRIGDDHGKGDTEMPVKILIDGHSIELADELVAKHVQGYITSMQTALADAKKKMSAAEEEQESEKKERGEKDAAAAALKGEIVALKKQLEDAVAASTDVKRVNDRIDLLLKASAAMDGKVNLDDLKTKSDIEIYRLVTGTLLGDAAKALSDAEVVGAFKAVTASIKPRTGTDRLADSLSLLSHGGGSGQNNPKAIKDAAYGEYLNNLGNAWKTRATA